MIKVYLYRLSDSKKIGSPVSYDANVVVKNKVIEL